MHNRISYGVGIFALLFSTTSLAVSDLEIAQLGNNIDRVWVFVASAMVFLMQGGFLLFEIGMCRSQHAPHIALKNILDWTVVSLTFFLIGFAIMFGHSENGIWGSDLYLLSGLHAGDAHKLGGIFFIFQLAFAGTAVTIISGVILERATIVTYLAIAFFTSAIIYPVIGHWIWGNLFFPENEPWLEKLGFMDFAGATVVHSTGAWVGLIAAIFIGKRTGRYTDDSTSTTINPFKKSNVAFSCLGIIVLWFGWWGFNAGSLLELNEKVGEIILNTNVVGASAGIAAFLHCFYLQDKENLLEKLLGGILGGLVASTACCDVITPVGAMLVGVTAGLVHNYSYDFITKTLKIDDAIGAIPVHGFCGVWGTLCVAIFGRTEALNLPRMEQFLVQGLGVLVCFLWCIATGWLLFFLLKRFVKIRLTDEEQATGIHIE